MTKFAYFLGSEQWQPEILIDHAKLAQEVGFDMVTISEHFHPWVDDHSASNFTWSTLGALANKDDMLVKHDNEYISEDGQTYNVENYSE